MKQLIHALQRTNDTPRELSLISPRSSAMDPLYDDAASGYFDHHMIVNGESSSTGRGIDR